MPGECAENYTAPEQRTSKDTSAYLYRDIQDLLDRQNSNRNNDDKENYQNGVKNSVNNGTAGSIGEPTPTERVNSMFAEIRKKKSEDVPYYTMDQVREHSSRDDAWIVLDDMVYDVTHFQHKHPGGPRVMTNFAGQDATDSWIAIHLRIDKVKKYMYNLVIGKLKRDRQEDIELLKKNAAINRDYYELKKEVEKEGLYKPSMLWLAKEVSILLMCEIAAYFLIAKYYNSWLAYLSAALMLTASQVQFSWLSHDCSHWSVLNTRTANLILQQIFMGVFRGSSSDWWNFRHHQHHTKPNIEDKDPSLGFTKAIMWGEKMAKKWGTAKQGTAPYHWQHIYISCVVTPLMWVILFPIENLAHVIKYKSYQDLPAMFLYYLRYYLCYVTLLGWWPALKLYFLFRLIEGPWYAYVIMCNHVPMEIDVDRPEMDWVTLQTTTTCDVNPGPFLNWFTGGLNLQLEHHFFPTMPRHNVEKTIPRVRALCEKYNLPYISKPIIQAFKDTHKSLRDSGKTWFEAYYM